MDPEFEKLKALAATLGLTLSQDADGRYVVDDNQGGKVWYDSLPEVKQDLEELQATEAPTATPTAPAATPQAQSAPPVEIGVGGTTGVSGVLSNVLGKDKAKPPAAPPAPPKPPKYPSKPDRWNELMPGFPFENAYKPKYRPVYNDVGMLVGQEFDYWEPSPAITEYNRRLTAGVPTPAPTEAAAQPDTIEYEGERFWRPNPNAQWQRIGKAGQTLDKALQEAVIAENPDWTEIDRLLAARDKIETTSPGYLQKERAAEETRRQNEIKNQQDQATIALDVQQQAIARAQSPGDWLAWWMMMRPDIQTTAEQFQQFGADRFKDGGVPTTATVGGAPAAAQIFKPRTEAIQPSRPGDFRDFVALNPGAQPPGFTPFTPREAAANMTPQDRAQYENFISRGHTAEAYAILGKYINAPRAATPFTGFSGTDQGFTAPTGFQTTNPAIAAELQRRQFEAQGTALQQTSPQQAAASQPGLNWLNIVLAGGQPPPNRQIPSIPGAPPFPSQQTLNQLLPSQQQGFQTAVQSTGVPWLDYQNQLQKTFNYTPAPRLRLQPRGV